MEYNKAKICKGGKNMKKIVSLIVLTIIMSFGICSFAQDIKVLVNGNQLEFDVPPQIINGRTMVPMRAIFESLGLKVFFDEETQTVIGTKDAVRIELKLNTSQAKVNLQDKTLDSPAVLIDGRTLVPARFIAECLHLDVNWDSKNQTVTIKNNPKIFSVFGKIQEIYTDSVDGSYLTYFRLDTGSFLKRSTLTDGLNCYFVVMQGKLPLKSGYGVTITGESLPEHSYVSQYGLNITLPTIKGLSYSMVPYTGKMTQ